MPAPFSTPIPYPRPARLSDPGHDFTPEECAAILAVPDDRLGWPELGEIFQSYLPAGDYAECAYFIPRALRFLDERGREASDVADNFIAWAGEQKRELDADGLFAPIRDHLVAPLFECLADEDNAVRARDILREGVRRDPSLAACWAKWFRGSSWTLDKPEEHPHPATP